MKHKQWPDGRKEANTLTLMNNTQEQPKPRMASLKTVCELFDWRYDTIWKKFKRGEFVQGYRDPAGRGIRFDLQAVETWARQEPIKLAAPSLLRSQL